MARLTIRKKTNANINVTDEMISPAILAQIGTPELVLA